MALYSKEQIEKANNINLEEFLRLKGEKLKQTGSEFKWVYTDASGEHDSISIYKNKWFDHKNDTGGYPVKFLQEFFGLSFREAVKELLHEDAESLTVINKQNNQEQRERQEFKLPPKAENMKALFAYLVKTRFLSPDIVKQFVKDSLMYQEEKHNNIVFLGMDENGVPKSAHQKSSNSNSSFKMTVAGSDPQYGFNWTGQGDKLYVFEAAVDLLSYLTINSDDWQKESYIALDGLSPKAMFRFLEIHDNIKEINICIDYDPAGIEANDKFRDMLMEKGYSSEQIKREYPIFKDWNEQLRAENNLKPIMPEGHPKKEQYHFIGRKLSILNAKTDSPYIQWKQQRYEKAGIDFMVMQIGRELKAMTPLLQSNNKESVKKAESNVMRIADLAITAACTLEEQNEIPQISVYQNYMTKLESGYRPYLDKQRIKNRYEELQREVDQLTKANKKGQSLFSCLKKTADCAIRFKVYMDTDFKNEMERKLNENKEEPEEAPTDIALV